MHGHQFFSEQDDQDKASRVAASNPHICDPGCSANLDVRDKNFSSVIMHGKGNTLLARAGEEGLKMFFVGEVVVTPTDGSKIRGLRAPAGKILVGGREVFMHVVPHPAFADLKSGHVRSSLVSESCLEGRAGHNEAPDHGYQHPNKSMYGN